jgi:hypothetical protein
MFLGENPFLLCGQSTVGNAITSVVLNRACSLPIGSSYFMQLSYFVSSNGSLSFFFIIGYGILEFPIDLGEDL